jgi:RNA polymerase sigma-70 factor (ECF subfamily)
MKEDHVTRHQDHDRAGAEVEELARVDRAGGRPSEELLAGIRPLACRWALVRTGDGDMAEDVAQEVLVRVVRSFESWSSRGRFTTWLYRVVANTARDVGRRAKRETERRARLSALAAPANPLLAPEARQVLRTLAEAMESLSPMQRVAFDLVDLQGYSGAEAAAMQQMNESTLRVHLSRARASVKAAIRAGSIT